MWEGFLIDFLINLSYKIFVKYKNKIRHESSVRQIIAKYSYRQGTANTNKET